MDYFSRLYIMILNLVKTIMGLFDGPTEYVDNLIKEYEENYEKNTETTV